ncbi:uncharacterized protein LOC142330681 [Lycorma delicatula]|uniref:uncharacterized protein LOC142330681 n=1 Tax=Lycorma delicatula TaxID=130591 RepID=UPI003F515AEB
MNSLPVLSLLSLYTLIINISLTIFITPTKCNHHSTTIKKHQNQNSKVYNHHNNTHQHKHYHEHKIKNYDKNSALNNTNNMTINFNNTTVIYSTNITTEKKTNTSDYYYSSANYNETSDPFYYYSIEVSTQAPKKTTQYTINYRRAELYRKLYEKFLVPGVEANTERKTTATPEKRTKRTRGKKRPRRKWRPTRKLTTTTTEGPEEKE